MHIRLDLSKAVSYERDILNSKEALIKSFQHLKNYRKLREKELDKKADMRDTLKGVHKSLKKMEKDLPSMEKEEKRKALKAEIQAENELEKEEIETEIPEVAETPAEEHKMTSLEKELLEIKKKLESLNAIRENPVIAEQPQIA